LKTKITLRDLGHVIDDIHKMGHKILLDIGGNRCTVALDGTKIGETLDPSSTTFGNRPKFSEAYLLLVGIRAGLAAEADLLSTDIKLLDEYLERKDKSK